MASTFSGTARSRKRTSPLIRRATRTRRAPLRHRDPEWRRGRFGWGVGCGSKRSSRSISSTTFALGSAALGNVLGEPRALEGRANRTASGVLPDDLEMRSLTRRVNGHSAASNQLSSLHGVDGMLIVGRVDRHVELLGTAGLRTPHGEVCVPDLPGVRILNLP